ncbi:hypothetical protein ACFL1X_09620 [Candidatus Hydrogenedentota bacterium]
MERWKVIACVFALAIVFFAIGNGRHDVLEIHNNGAAMCLACVGLE